MATVNYDLEYKRKRKRKGNEDDDIKIKSRIDDLNDTLLELIFTKLSPWKYVVISKSVSKRWNSIISNPGFSRQLPPQSFPITLVDSDGKCLSTEHPYFQKHKFNLDFIPNIYKIVASTNDLIAAYGTYTELNSRKPVVYIANPLTKQYIVVPKPSAERDSPFSRDIMVGIAGFLDRFRIVLLINRKPKSSVQIYSSETGQWKTYNLFHYFEGGGCRSRFGPPKAITRNNKIYWKIRSKLVVIDPFNIDNVAPRLVNLPTEFDGYFNSTLNICQNRLRVGKVKNQRIKIWEIEDYDNVDNLGTNYSDEVKLVKRLVLNREIPSDSTRICCCHPTDPQIVYLSKYAGTSFRYNVVENKRKIIGHNADFLFNTFVLAHPP